MNVHGRVQDTNPYNFKAHFQATVRTNPGLNNMHGTVDEHLVAIPAELPGSGAAVGMHAGGSGPPARPHCATQAPAVANTQGVAACGSMPVAAANGTPARPGTGPLQAAWPSPGSKRRPDHALDLFTMMEGITKSCKTMAMAGRTAVGDLPAQPHGGGGSGTAPRELWARRTGTQDLLPLQHAGDAAISAKMLPLEGANAAPAAAAAEVAVAAAPSAGGLTPQPSSPLPPQCQQPAAALQAPRYPGDREKVHRQPNPYSHHYSVPSMGATGTATFRPPCSCCHHSCERWH